MIMFVGTIAPVIPCLISFDTFATCSPVMTTYVTLIGLEMLVFNLTIHHLWGRVLTKFPETRVIVYADDGCIKAKLRVTLQVLAELKRVLKEDPDLELNVSKTSVLPKGVTQQTAFDVLILSVLKVSLASVCLLVLILLYRTL